MGHEHQHCAVSDAYDRKVLYIALILNFSMFLLEVWQGMRVDSTSLLADAMDFLSDSFSYVLTLFVLGKSLQTRAKASLTKAGLMLLLAAFALWQGVQNVMHGVVPDAYTMGWVSVLALLVNLATAAMLFRSRGKDSNMQSVWLCSRNDAINNIMVLIAAGLVAFSNSLWPDLLAALVIAWIESKSALKVIRQARSELRTVNQ